jgi:hypothetical protein
MSYAWESQIETLMVNVNQPLLGDLANYSEEEKFKKQSSESSDCSESSDHSVLRFIDII